MTTTKTHQPQPEIPGLGDQKLNKVTAPQAKKSAAAFRTISEVADALGVQQHVLRFWETKFSQIKPLKRGGGRRYYRPEDVALLRRIHTLLYTEGYTIKGVQKLLREQGRAQLTAGVEPQPQPAPMQGNVPRPAPATAPARAAEPAARPGLSDRQRVILESMLGELKDLRAMIRGAE